MKVEAWHLPSGFVVKEGIWPGLRSSAAHEVAGRIDAVGGNVTAWSRSARRRTA